MRRRNLRNRIQEGGIIQDSPFHIKILILLGLIAVVYFYAKSVSAIDSTKILAIEEQQTELYAKTGVYTQVKRNGDFEGGLGEEQLVLSALADDSYEIHVYSAPCGEGYKILEYTDNFIWTVGTTSGKMEQYWYEEINTSVYGCLTESI